MTWNVVWKIGKVRYQYLRGWECFNSERKMVAVEDGSYCTVNLAKVGEGEEGRQDERNG